MKERPLGHRYPRSPHIKVFLQWDQLQGASSVFEKKIKLHVNMGESRKFGLAGDAESLDQATCTYR